MKRPFAGTTPNANDKRLRNSLHTNDMHLRSVPGTGRRCNLGNTKGLRRRLSFALPKKRILAYNGALGSRLVAPMLTYILVKARYHSIDATNGADAPGRAVFFICPERCRGRRRGSAEGVPRALEWVCGSVGLWVCGSRSGRGAAGVARRPSGVTNFPALQRKIIHTIGRPPRRHAFCNLLLHS